MKLAAFAYTLVALAAPVSATEAAFSIMPIANLQYDFNRFHGDAYPFNDAHDFRRARLGLLAKKDGRYEAKLEFDFQSQEWTDLYIKAISDRYGALRVGHFKQPIGLDDLTSSKWTTFMERALPVNLAITRRIGVEYSYFARRWSVALTGFGQDSSGANAGRGYALRGTWLPIQDERRLLHFGAAWAREDPRSDTVQFRTRPEARLTEQRLIDSGTLNAVQDIDRVGLEAAWVQGPWSVQGEYLQALAHRSGAPDAQGQGWYVYGSWFPSGHSRGYQAGEFAAPKMAEGEHAWELALRYSTLDLDSAAVSGGRQSDWTAGVNFYVNRRLRFMANYVRVNSERAGVPSDPNILELRAQWVF